MPRQRNPNYAIIRRKWEETDITAIELGIEFNLTESQIRRIVSGLKRYHSGRGHMSLDVLSGAGVQIDTEGNIYGLKAPFYYPPLETLDKQPNPEYTKIVACPNKCGFKGTANKLLAHLVTVHKRFDLEYLLES